MYQLITTFKVSKRLNDSIGHCIHFMSKKVRDNLKSCDICLSQVLGTIRLDTNELTQLFLFYLLYNRNAVFPIDSIV